MHRPMRIRLWVVEPHDDLRVMLRDLVAGIGADADVLPEADFRARLDRGQRPDALLIDGSSFLRLDGGRVALDGVLRTLVVTGHPATQFPRSLLDRPSVRFLQKPFAVEAMEGALLWLSGASDDSWADPAGLPSDGSEATTALG